MSKIVPVPNYNDLAPAGTPPHIAIAPELRGAKPVVVREADESEERYQGRCELLSVFLDFVARQD